MVTRNRQTSKCIRELRLAVDHLKGTHSALVDVRVNEYPPDEVVPQPSGAVSSRYATYHRRQFDCQYVKILLKCET